VRRPASILYADEPVEGRCDCPHAGGPCGAPADGFSSQRKSVCRSCAALLFLGWARLVGFGWAADEAHGFAAFAYPAGQTLEIPDRVAEIRRGRP